MATLAVIMAFGLVMLYSASYTTGYLRMGDSLHYIKQQILCMAIGIGCMAAMSYVDHRFLRWACKPCYWIVLLMLAATLAFPPLNGWRRRVDHHAGFPPADRLPPLDPSGRTDPADL